MSALTLSRKRIVREIIEWLYFRRHALRFIIFSTQMRLFMEITMIASRVLYWYFVAGVFVKFFGASVSEKRRDVQVIRCEHAHLPNKVANKMADAL